MNPVVLSLEGLLAVLLGATLFMGIKLERKLKALRNSQAGFASAVRDLDTAAARTEAGLDALRHATDGARDVLVQRMEAAQAMALRLEGLTAEAETAAMRAQAAADTALKSHERVASAAAAAEAAAAAAAAVAEARALARPDAYAAPIALRAPEPDHEPAREPRASNPVPAHRRPAAEERMPEFTAGAAANGSSRLRQAADLLRGSRR